MNNSEKLLVTKELEGLLSPLDSQARDTVMLAIRDMAIIPPMNRLTIAGEEDWTTSWEPGGASEDGTSSFTYSQVEKMMATGEIAYPMALKKAPIISIVNAVSGFKVECPDQRLARIMKENLHDVLPRTIHEILTFLENGSYFAEVTWEPGYPQDYGLVKSPIPYWLIGDFNACHITTIEKIHHDNKNRFDGFTQNPPTGTDPIRVNLERSLVIPNNGGFGNYNGTSILEPVYVWWFWYELIWRAFLRFLQRAGVGVVLVKCPSRGQVMVNDTAVAAMDYALQLSSSLHRTNYAAVPSDTDPESGKELWAVDYLKTGDRAEGQQFVDALKLLGDNIRNFLLTGESNEGDPFDVMLDTEQTLSHVGTYISRYVLRKGLAYNGSSARRIRLDFQGANTRVLPLLFKLMAVAGNTVGDALQNVDWRELFTKGGVPVLTEEQVEELKEEKKKEEEEAAERLQKRQEEPARGQPGGEGRWVSQRDKEGQPEKLGEFVSNALDAQVVALTRAQVEELENLGIRASDEPIVLFNPYHDVIGRFTDKAHATSPYPKSHFTLDGKVSNRAAFRVNDAASLAAENLGMKKNVRVVIYKKQSSYGQAVCGDDLRCKVASRRTYAVYSPGSRTVHISNRAANEIERNRKLGSYMVNHEFTHARERSDGSFSANVDFSNKSELRRSHTRRFMEEGLTDLLSRKSSGVKMGTGHPLTSPHYRKQMGAMGLVAYRAAGGDREKAWEIIDQMHYRINDDAYIHSVLTDALDGREPRGGWNNESYQATINRFGRASEWNRYRFADWMFKGR